MLKLMFSEIKSGTSFISECVAFTLFWKRKKQPEKLTDGILILTPD